MINHDVGPEHASLLGPRQRALTRVLRLAIDMDPREGSRLVGALQRHLGIYDEKTNSFCWMEDYAHDRLLDLDSRGFPICFDRN